MESKECRIFLMKIQTSDTQTLDVWNLLIDVLTQEDLWYSKEFLEFSNETHSNQSIIITTLHEKNEILIKTYGLFENETLLPSQIKRILLEAIWDMLPSSIKESNLLRVHTVLIRQYMEQGISLEELHEFDKPS